jgi:molybdopterin molybdotransferase
LLLEMDYGLHVDQVRVRPGRPLLFAARGQHLAFGLPGNPVSHAACFHLFVKPALHRMQGLPETPALRQGRLSQDWSIRPEPREVYWPARVKQSHAETWLEPVRWESSGHLSALAGIGGFLRVPENAGAWRAGEVLDYLPLT